MKKISEVNYRVLVAVGVLLFFAVASLYTWEFSYFNRYLSFTRIMIVGLLVGGLLGGLGAWYWSRRFSDWYDRLRLSLGVVLAGILLGPLLLSLANRLLDPRPAFMERVEFVRGEGRFHSRFGLPNADELVDPNSYHLYFYRQSSLERVIFSRPPEKLDFQRGDTLTLEIKPGLLGMPWVRSIAASAE